MPEIKPLRPDAMMNDQPTGVKEPLEGYLLTRGSDGVVGIVKISFLLDEHGAVTGTTESQRIDIGAAFDVLNTACRHLDRLMVSSQVVSSLVEFFDKQRQAMQAAAIAGKIKMPPNFKGN